MLDHVFSGTCAPDRGGNGVTCGGFRHPPAVSARDASDRDQRRARTALVRNALVDTGSELSWLPEDVRKSIGVDVFKEGERFVMANGRTIRRDVGIAVLRAATFKTVDEVVLAHPGDMVLLGARTIEGFNASGGASASSPRDR
jgi:hypothetical protein